VWKDWIATDYDEASSDDENVRATEHITKKRKSIGKMGKGEDFWSRVEKWLDQKILEWGSDMNSLEWKT